MLVTSLVLCGVDGTVYMLDAYTGKLEGMLTSDPSLVSSSLTDKDGTADKDGNVPNGSTGNATDR